MADSAHPHVVLVGLSATGKTSIGKLVAQRLEMPFVDTDDAIEQRTDRSVRDLFASEGEPRFRHLEAEVVSSVLLSREPSVVATGGGAVVTPSTRERLRAPDVFVVWLTAEPAFLASRAAGKVHRPLLDDDPVAALARLATERQPWFEEVADVRVNVQRALSTEPKPVAKARLADHITDLMQLRLAQRARDHIVLVGPMGVGKSTIGRIVADRLHRPYVDSDDIIEQRTGHTAREIAEHQGLDALHDLEVQVLRDALAMPEPAVLGSAASVVDEEAGRLALGTARHVVWLRADPDELTRRRAAGGSDHRPEVDPAVVAARAPRYEASATSIVDVDHLAPEVVADKVLGGIEQ
jgi:shikimate kinase